MKTYNTHKPYLCIDCGAPVGRRVKFCSDCRQKYYKTRGTYERTEAHRQRMSEALKGKRHHWRSGSTRPEVAEKIKAWWTPERKEAKRKEVLKRNPNARYHGLSAKAARKIVLQDGRCAYCGDDGSGSRLGVHHKDGDKHNQAKSNLIVLCHKCHMQEHAKRKETGWDLYWKKRKTTQG